MASKNKLISLEKTGSEAGETSHLPKFRWKTKSLIIPMGDRSLRGEEVTELVISMEEKEGPNYKVMESLIIDNILL